MVPPTYASFFITLAGAAAGLLGLLFVAVAVRPEHIFTETSTKQANATCALTAFGNVLFVSLAAVIPTIDFSWVTLGFSLLAFANNLGLVWTMLLQEKNGRLTRRRLSLVAYGVALTGIESYYALRLILTPGSSDVLNVLTYLLLGILVLGILRAWETLGARGQRFNEWLGPRRYTADETPLPARQEQPVQ